MFTAALMTIPKIWKQHKWIKKWIKMWYKLTTG